MFRKRGKLKPETKAVVKGLLAARKARAGVVWKHAKPWVWFTIKTAPLVVATKGLALKRYAFLAGREAHKAVLKSPKESLREEFRAASQEVKNATNRVGAALTEEAKANEKFRQFLQRVKYVMVDRKGLVWGATTKGFVRIGKYDIPTGRMRLETGKILEGKYAGSSQMQG